MAPNWFAFCERKTRIGLSEYKNVFFSRAKSDAATRDPKEFTVRGRHRSSRVTHGTFKQLLKVEMKITYYQGYTCPKNIKIKKQKQLFSALHRGTEG